MCHHNNTLITVYWALFSAGSKHKTLYRQESSPTWQMGGQGTEKCSHWPRSHSRTVIHARVSPPTPLVFPLGTISFLVSPAGLKCTTLASQAHTCDSLLLKHLCPKGQAETTRQCVLPYAQLFHQQTFAEHSLCTWLSGECSRHENSWFGVQGSGTHTGYQPHEVHANRAIWGPGIPESIRCHPPRSRAACLSLLGLYSEWEERGARGSHLCPPSPSSLPP